MTIDQLIHSLTLKDLAAYKDQQDPLIWIEYNLLDPNNLPRKFAVLVENAFFSEFTDAEWDLDHDTGSNHDYTPSWHTRSNGQPLDTEE